MKFHEKFRMQRMSNKITQQDLADLCGYSTTQFISNVERGLCYFPRDVLFKICRQYSLNYRDLAETIVEEKKAELARSLKTEWFPLPDKRRGSSGKRSRVVSKGSHTSI